MQNKSPFIFISEMHLTFDEVTNSEAFLIIYEDAERTHLVVYYHYSNAKNDKPFVFHKNLFIFANE